MKLIIEKHLKLENALKRLSLWKLPFDIEYVENIKNSPFDIFINGDWSIIMPKEENVAFIYDYNLHKEDTKNYAGGAFLKRFSVIVFDNDLEEILELRIVHEYLHSIGKDADGLKKNVPVFLNLWERIMWFFRFVIVDEQSPYWQRKFYKWMLSKP